MTDIRLEVLIIANDKLKRQLKKIQDLSFAIHETTVYIDQEIKKVTT